jgi:hypothetical protein
VTALLAAVAAALVTGFFAWYAQAWRFRRESGNEATRVLRENRDPLLRAAFDLQSRLYNIVAGSFLDHYWYCGNADEKAYAIRSTLWLIGQYLGRVEILRREVQYLDLGSRSVNQKLQRRLSDISRALASDAPWLGGDFITFRTDQRAIGEFMLTEREIGGGGKRPDCLGYSEFVERLGSSLAAPDGSSRARSLWASRLGLRSRGAANSLEVAASPFAAWAARLSSELEEAAKGASIMLSQPRLITAQRRLIDLVDLLDADRVRYPALDERGKLPVVPVGAAAPRERIAAFVWPFGDPWREIDRWARSGYKCKVAADGGRSYLGHRHLTGWRSEFHIRYADRLEVDAWITRVGRRNQRYIDGSLRSRRARHEVNELLTAFERPLLAGGATLPDRFVQWVATQARRWSRDARIPSK